MSADSAPPLPPEGKAARAVIKVDLPKLGKEVDEIFENDRRQFKPGQRLVDANKRQYWVDEGGALHRVAGGKLSKAEQKAAKRARQAERRELARKIHYRLDPQGGLQRLAGPEPLPGAEL